MTVLPLQAFGIGDVIFSQQLVRTVANGNRIAWAVMDIFKIGLQRAYPDIEFIDQNGSGIDFDIKEHKTIQHGKYGDCVVLPIRWADSILRVPYNDCMRAKYDLYGMDYNDWTRGAMWQRDAEREQALIKHVGFTGGSLGNALFGSNCTSKVNLPKCDTQMQVISGYSLFDWAGIIEQASEIHTVNTSIIYLLEMLDLTAKEIHLYQRPIKGQSFDNVKYLLKRHRYILHG